MTEYSILALVIAIISIVVSLTWNILSKIFDIHWNRTAKDLNEILDIDKKLDHKNDKVQELVQFHTAKYLIDREERQYRRREEYFATLSNYDGIIFYLGQIAWRVLLGGLSVWVVITILPVSDYLWLAIWSFAIFTVLRVSTVRLSRIVSRNSSATPTKRYEFELRKSGQKHLTGKIRARKQLDGRPVIYDFIGRPDNINELHLYKRVSNKETATVYYEYMTSRELSNLEVEWVTGLNKIKRFRRTAPYIPYVVPDNRKWTHHPSAFHLVWKD